MRRHPLVVGIGAALVADAAAYAALPGFHALLSRQHWILYAYVALMAGALGALAAAAVPRLWAAEGTGPRPNAWTLFAACLALYSLTSLGRIDSYDGEMMFRVTESLVERHSLVVRDEIFHASEPYAIYGLAPSLLAIPFYLVAKAAGADPRWAVSFANALVTAATVALTYRLGRELGFPARRGGALALVLAVGTLAWPYARTFFSEPLVALFLVAATLAAHRLRACARPADAALLGAALGAAVLTREDSVIALPLYGAYLLYPGVDRRRFLATKLLTAGAVSGGALLALAAWYHAHRYGGVFASPLQQIGHTFDLAAGSIANATYGQLLSSGKGLLFYAPIVSLALFGWPSFWRLARAECLLFGGLALERVLFFSAWPRWDGGISWGPRFLVPIVPLLVLASGYARPARWLAVALAALSVLVQLPGVALLYTDPLDAAMDGMKANLEQIYFVPRYSPILVGLRLLLEGSARPFVPIADPAWRFPVHAALAAAAALLGRRFWLGVSSTCPPPPASQPGRTPARR